MLRLHTEHIKSLNEDELSMLWFIVNMVQPKIMSYEITPNLFTSLNFNLLQDRVMQCDKFFKDEYQVVFNEMKRKLGMPVTPPPAPPPPTPPATETPAQPEPTPSGSVEASGSATPPTT